MRWEKRKIGMIVCKVLRQEQMIEKNEAEKGEEYRRIRSSGEALQTDRDLRKKKEEYANAFRDRIGCSTKSSLLMCGEICLWAGNKEN